MGRCALLVRAILLWIASLSCASPVSTASLGGHSVSSLKSIQHNGFTLPGAVVWGCSSLTRGVHLTFDDGPSNNTHLLLDTLKELGVKATFFFCGGGASRHHDIVQRAAAEGHDIGQHTWWHVNLTRVMAEGDLARLEHEVIGTEDLITNLTGKRPVLFRPPYGAVSAAVRQMLAARGYTIVMWSGGCIDWWLNDMDAELPIMINGMADAGAILCMHDTTPTTCTNIAQLINLLTTDLPRTTANPQGRRMLSMAECMADPADGR